MGLRRSPGLKQRLASLHILIDKINVVETASDEASVFARLTQADGPLVVSFINQNALNLAWRSPDFASHLINSDLVLRDGIGMQACLTALGRTVGRNMNGTDLIPRIAAAFSGRTAVLFGTVDPWTSRAATALNGLGCNVVATLDGFRPEADYVAELRRTKPDLVILAMGNPRQEAVASVLAAAADYPVVIVNGGAIADFLAARFERAPVWAQRAGCEWLFRLAQEPRRLWRRYLVGGVSFAWHVVQLRIAFR